MEQRVGMAIVLMRYFRPAGDQLQPGISHIQRFTGEYKKLDPAHALELAQLAARELGLTKEQVTFSLESE